MAESGNKGAVAASFAQSGAGTMGAIMDFIRSGQAQRYNEKLFKLNQYMDSRNRQDALYQQRIDNATNQQALNNQTAKTNADISQGGQALQMQKNQQMVTNLRSAFSANPALYNGVLSLFGAK